MKPKYDVFISYRRKGGLAIARCICYYLRSKGVRCFFDLREINEGKFDEAIFGALKRSKYTLLLLTEGSLDRCVDKGDWVRKEIEYSMSIKDKRHDIIPLTIKGQKVVFPESLPDSFTELAAIQQESIDDGRHFERDIDDMLVKRMKRVGKRVAREFNRDVRNRAMEAEAAFRSRAEFLKDTEKIRIDIGGGHVKLLQFAEELDIDKQRACILIEEVNSAINRRRRFFAWMRTHAVVSALTVFLSLFALGWGMYYLLPVEQQSKIEEKIVCPFSEQIDRIWGRLRWSETPR